ncbi:MAG: hypothetical protein Q4G63_03685 [Bacteroidia bacterium]|nr:hypothetical protein [Bacteroidia bacterium]
MKKSILTMFALAALVITSCNDKGKEPEIPPTAPVNPMEKAIYMLTSQSGVNTGGSTFDIGKLLILTQDGLSENMFEKANPDKSLGHAARYLTMRENKLFVFSLTDHINNVPRITVINNNTLKIEKDIVLDALVIQGIPDTPLGMHVVSSKKVYLFYAEKAFVVDLELGKKTKEITGFKDGFAYSPNAPLFEINDKLCGLIYNSYIMETNFVTIDTKTDAIQYIPITQDIPAQLILKDKDNNLLIFSKGILDEIWKFFTISTSGKVIKEKELTKSFSGVAAVSSNEPIIFYQGTEDNHKKIYKWNYETDKTELFADLKTNKPKFDQYRMRLAVHPVTKELLVSVSDDIVTKFIRVYDSKSATLPATHKKEYGYNGKFRVVQEFVFNKKTTDKTVKK